MEPLLTIIISTYDEGILELKKAIKIENPSIKYLIVFQNPKHIRIPDFLNRKDIDIIDSKTKGLSVSRNIGIENCKTPYALLSDDDVEYIEEGLDQVLEIIQKEKIDFATFKIKTYDGEPEYNDYSSEKEEIKNIQHYISSIEILVNLQTLKLKKIKFDERFGLGTFLMKGEEEILIHDLQKKNSIGFYFPIYIATSLEDALHRREKLPAGGAFVTQQGHLVSRVGVQLYAADSEQAGMLARAQEMESLEKQLRAQQLMQSELQGELDQCVANYQAAHQAAEQARIAAEQAVQEAHGFEVERMQLTQAEEQYSQRATQIQNELNELRQQMEQLGRNQEQSATELNASEDSKQGSQEALASAQEKLEIATQERDRLRESLRAAEMAAQEAAFATRSLQQRIADLQRDQSTARTQIMEIQDKHDLATQELESLSDEEAQEKLQGLLLARSAREAAALEMRAPSMCRSMPRE